MTVSELKDFVIIVTSDEPYSKMWHTQLIYTEFLSKSNAVIYIDPPKKWSLKNIFKKFEERKEGRNLTIVDYANRLPVFFKWFDQFNEKQNESKISKKIKEFGVKKVIVWHFDSYRNAFSNHFFDSSLIVKRIYHVIDPFYKNPIDRWLCNKVDQIVITSARNNKYYSDFSKKMINVPQCLDMELQKKLLNGTSSIKQQFNENYFVLLGTISDDIDFDWLLDLLKSPNFKLVIIGKITNLNRTFNWNQIITHENVEYLGLLSPDEFYPILKKASGGLIVYNEERRAKVCSPLKALNYIISGLPVITNIDCEIPQLTDNSVYYATTSSNCNDLIELALSRNLKVDEVMINDYLSKVSMSNAIETIIKNI